MKISKKFKTPEDYYENIRYLDSSKYPIYFSIDSVEELKSELIEITDTINWLLKMPSVYNPEGIKTKSEIELNELRSVIFMNLHAAYKRFYESIDFVQSESRPDGQTPY